MKKNSQYIGVDEKFIPEDEKYVDDSLLGGKEKTKKVIGKTAKVIGIGYLIYAVIFLVIFIAVFVMVFKFMGSQSKQAGSFFSQISNQIGSSSEQFSNFDSKFEKDSFNSKFELYSGTVKKMIATHLLDEVIKNNKTNSSQIIKVIYNENNTTDSNNILEMKKQLNDDKEYEVILDYDANGYVNQVTIEDM